MKLKTLKNQMEIDTHLVCCRHTFGMLLIVYGLSCFKFNIFYFWWLYAYTN